MEIFEKAPLNIEMMKLCSIDINAVILKIFPVCRDTTILTSNHGRELDPKCFLGPETKDCVCDHQCI